MKENNNIEIQKEAPNCAELIKELTKYKEEGCALYKEKKIEEAKAKFKEGFDKFEKESAKISKESSNNEEYKEIIILGKKLLSNLALCYYKQGKYAEAIDYDIKLLTSHPKFGKSIVRLFNSYSRLNKIQQAVYYGELFLELDQETRDKFKGTQTKVQNEKQAFKKLEEAEQAKIKKEFGSPAGDNKWDENAMYETFLMTNICPQNQQLNSGLWNQIEMQCRYWTKKYGTLYIVCGPIFLRGEHQTIGPNRVMVPEAFFKAILCLEGEPKGIAFVCRNTKGDRKKDYYVNTIRQVERITGYNLFPHLDDKISYQVKDHADITEW